MTAPARTSRWSRRFVLVAILFLVCWQIGTLLGITQRSAVTLGLLGFVFHTIFGKAYSLLPSYFDRGLATNRLMPVHFLCTVTATVCLTLNGEISAPVLRTAGGVLWAVGVGLFLGTVLWTVRDNITGRETGTGTVNAERQTLDRVANLFMPLALAYLAVGSYELLALGSPLPALTDGYEPRVYHLLAAGTGALLVFAIGFRLLPRFMAATPPSPLVWVVLPAGAVGPALLALSIPAGPLLIPGALAQTVAVGGFAIAVVVLSHRSDRERVGFIGVLTGVCAGVLAVALGVVFAVGTPTGGLITTHMRLNLLGFLGLVIVGVSYQFYPPAVGTFRGANDRTARAAILLLAGGLAVELIGVLVAVIPLVTGGYLLALLGSLVHAYLIAGLFHERFG